MHRIQVLRPLLTRRLSSAAPIAPSNRPFFSCKPPLWARWTWALVVADIVMTAGSVDIYWNYWREKSVVENVVSQLDSDASQDNQEDRWVPAPTWKRVGACVGCIGLGVGCAAALLFARSRFVRSLDFAIQPNQSRQLIIQTASRPQTFRLKDCKLSEGRHEREFVLSIAGRRGAWHIGLTDGVIDGVSTPPLQARQKVFDRWIRNGGKLDERWNFTPSQIEPRWKSGPILRP